jgi:outer membrane protein assembly factor BamB
VIVFAVGVEAMLGACATAAVPAWTTYRHDAARTGIDPDSANPVTPSRAWQTPPLDGEVYAQPLVYGPYVYVATENDTIYELDAVTGAVVWSKHLATPEPDSAAPCGDISPSIGITSTPVLDPTTNTIYAVSAVSDGVHASSVRHDLFALDLGSGRSVAGFPVGVDPPYPTGGAPVNQLQRPGLALDDGRILIGFGGNDGDCRTYWGWLVSAPADGTTELGYFQADPGANGGAIWASGNAPAIDAAGDVFIATGNGSSTTSAGPDYGESVVKLNAVATPLDWWAPANWHELDVADADVGSSMPTLLPGGYLFQSGKHGNGDVLNGDALGAVSTPPADASPFCLAGSFGGSVYDPANATIYAACRSGVAALAFAIGSPPSITADQGFSAPAGATGPPMIAGGLVWATNYSTGTLYGLDPTSGTARATFSIPENGTKVNHFASPSAGGGRLFIGSGDQVTAYTIGHAPAPVSTTTKLVSSANPAGVGNSVSLTAQVTPAPYGGKVTLTDGSAPINRCAGMAVSAATRGRATCRTTFTSARTHNVFVSYSGDAFDLPSSSPLREAVGPRVSQLHVDPRRVSVAGRKVGGQCVRQTRQNRQHSYCLNRVKLQITFRLDLAATVTLTFRRRRPGLTVNVRCRGQTTHDQRHLRCPQLAVVHGRISLVGKAGANAYLFRGAVGGAGIGPGQYQLTATPSIESHAGAREQVWFQVLG